MARLFVLFLLSLALLGCTKEGNEKSLLTTCEVANPIEDLPWLRDLTASLVDCGCEISIVEGTYEMQTVFFLALTDPVCNGVVFPTLQDCDGAIIRTFTIEDYEEFPETTTFDKVWYRCKT